MSENLMVLVAQLAEHDGVSSIDKLPGLWERKIDHHWILWLNGHDVPMAPPHTSVPVPPYHCLVEFNGWPAGLFTIFDGEFAAGELANEETFVQALKAAIGVGP